MSALMEGAVLEVNKFKQASSDHHQMSLEGAVSGLMSRGVPNLTWPVPRGRYNLSHDAFDVTYPAPSEQPDTCENITFLQLRLQAVTRKKVFRGKRQVSKKWQIV